MNRAFRVTARTESSKAAVSPMIDQALGQDAARGVSRAQEQHVVDSLAQAQHLDGAGAGAGAACGSKQAVRRIDGEVDVKAFMKLSSCASRPARSRDRRNSSP